VGGMKLIKRTAYLDRLANLRGTSDVKIITGVRRAGKSKILAALRERILSEGGANVIFIDLLDLANESLRDYHALNDYVIAQTKEGVENVLMIDEVQECASFERTINSLQNTGRYDIYLTGSNAFLLSSDLATLFTGRQMEIPVFPFSFAEFCDYFSEESDRERLLDRYLVEGGLAGSYVYRSERDRTDYVKEVFETILTRDLVQKFRLTEPMVLRRLAEYLMDNVSNLTSPNKTCTQLAQNKVATNHVTAANYMDHLTRAFLFYPARRYDVRGKKYLATLEKYYLSDLGFRYATLGRRNMDYGRALENVVYLELLRRGYETYVGKVGDLEIDFIAMRGNEKMYVQVSTDISDKETFRREIAPFAKIKDAYPRLLLARTRQPEYDYEGLRIVNLADWLACLPT
jgi:uncharacterized protein